MLAGCTKHIFFCCRHATISSTHAQTRPAQWQLPHEVFRCTSGRSGAAPFLQGMHSKRCLPPEEERCTSSLQAMHSIVIY